ncbi:MAG: nicotinamide mononucleotide transporter [Leptospiraceae bacterium]|nr:nicotinamide mononucleotide transporter [Leptospiraceae bacterium]
MDDLYQTLWQEMQNLETIGVFFGLISVGLTVKENIWCWPFGILNVILFGWIFFKSAIYGQMILQSFFFILILYGWYQWLYGKENNKSISIKNINGKEILVSIPVTILTAIIIAFGIRFFSEKENFTTLDSLITALSFTAQYFLAKKIIENWIIWVLIDIISVFLFIQTGLYKIGFFYFLLSILATTGYISWKKKLAN